MNILGISCHYHDSAACLVSNGKVVAAAQEERFNRKKNSADFPLQAINYCLQAGGLTVYDLDYVGFYEKPYLKFQRVLLNHIKSYPLSLHNFMEVMPHWLDDRLILPLILRNELGYTGKTLFIRHHLAHAASAFLPSGFREAAIITSDGVGEFATLTIGRGEGTKIEIIEELHYPNSLGLLYSAITSYLGFEANQGEGKVMALADYGKPAYLDRFRKIIDIKPDGSFAVDESYFGFNRGSLMYTSKFIRLFGPPRQPNTKLEQRHLDLAATLQKLTEDILLAVSRRLHRTTGLDNLCLSGGTFLNCVANTKLLQESGFKRLFIQPAAGDSGGALGAALYIHNTLLKNPRSFVMRDAYLGPGFSDAHILRFLNSQKISFTKKDNAALTRFVAKKLSENKIIGLFSGRMEFGPRALGARSILANPSNPKMRDFLNQEVKHREWFRPYGVAILKQDLGDFFELSHESPFMLLTARAKSTKRKLIPSALHVNGTSRIQTITKENGLLYSVVAEFKRLTSIPMIINTSFNDANEPIVCTPEQAYACFSKTYMDYLILGNYIIEKQKKGRIKEQASKDKRPQETLNARER